MKCTKMLTGVASIALLTTPTLLQACGEGMFSTGNGLAYQGYLAPRPAAILVYSSPDESGLQRAELHQGLQQAGHSVVVVESDEELRMALAERRFDVVLASFDAADMVIAATPVDLPAPRVLPVVTRHQRKSAQVRDHYEWFVLDGASLGQYLRAINASVKLAGK